MRKIQYVVNPMTMIVVAILKDCEEDFIDLIEKSLDDKYILIWGGHKRYKLKKQYVAKAICHPNDEFDAEIGKDIATRRLLNAYEADKLLLAKKFSEDMNCVSKFVLDKAIERREKARNYHKGI